MSVSAQEVVKLRRMSGAGMMDCKKALTESGGDLNKAMEHLRKQGQKLSLARAERSTTEGRVLIRLSEDKKQGMMLVMACETDFVAKNEAFQALSDTIADEAFNATPHDKDALLAHSIDGLSVAERIDELVAKIGEKIAITYYEQLTGGRLVAYLHAGDRLGVLVALNQTDQPSIADEVGKNVAMQVAAMKPMALNKDSLSEQQIEKELEIGRELARKEGKPDAILDKIAYGRLQKFLKEQTLMQQAYVKDNSLSIEQYVRSASPDLRVTGFLRRSTTD